MPERTTGNKPLLVLASKSPRRKALLLLLGVPFEACDASIAETTADTPIETVTQNAITKAHFCFEKYPDCLVLSADTVIEFEGRQIGKPRDIDQARQFLLGFSGKTHTVVTAVCLLGPRFGPHTATDVSLVTFFKLSEKDINDYLNNVKALDKAGGYGIQEQGWRLVEKLEGTLDNVMGLPLSCVLHLLSLAHQNGLR